MKHPYVAKSVCTLSNDQRPDSTPFFPGTEKMDLNLDPGDTKRNSAMRVSREIVIFDCFCNP